MATGDAALEAGMDVVLATDDRRQGYDEINLTRDYIAGEMAARQEADAGKVDKPDDGALMVRREPGSAHSIGFYTTPDSTLWFRPLVGTGTFDRRVITQPELTAAIAGIVPPAPDLSPYATHGEVDSVRDGNLTPGVYGRNITWTRRAAWVGDNGQLGYASSRLEDKQDLSPVEWTAEQLLAVPVLHYRYRAAVAEEAAGGPRAATEIGSIADALHTLGLWELVIYDGRGEDATPVGIHYELLGLAALWLAQEAYRLAASNAARIDTLEAGHADH